MIPTKAIEDALANDLAADTTTLAVATFLDVALVSAPFTPGPSLTTADLTLVTAAGLAAKTTTSAVIVVARDPVTGDYLIIIPAPTGGWNYIAGGAGLPLTIYGAAVMDHADNSKLYGAVLFPTPIVINAAGQLIDLDEVQFRLPSGVMS